MAKKQKNSTLVMKFGGTSVGSVEALNQTADIITKCKQDWEDLVVVASAMSGVTNSLLAGAQAAIEGDEKACDEILADLRQRHNKTIEALLEGNGEQMAVIADVGDHLDELEAFYAGVRTMGEVTNRGMDSIASFGERMNVRTLSALMRHRGLKSQPVDATELIVTDDNFQSANPIMDLSREKVQAVLKPMLKQGVIPIVTGFIGANKAGILTTLGRGGSDYTASILGVCLDADEVYTWTDVDGVMTADPRVVKDAQVIPEISYNEVSEMAYFGAKVLHPKTIQPLVEREIPLWVKNTFNPEYTGTRIAKNVNKSHGKVVAVSSIKDLSMITVQGRGMLGVPGIAARTFSAVARQDASVLMISQSSSEQSICFVIPTANAAGVVKMLEQELALEIERRDIDRVWQQPEVVIVTVIGAGLRNVPGVSAKVFGALGESNVNIIAIAQGSSEYSISMVIPAQDADLAVQQIHKKVVLNGG